MSQKYPGGFIVKNPPLPSGPFQNSTARGIWTLDQALLFKQQGLWPTAGNVAPTTIGQAYGGGFYAGQISTTANGVVTHYLIVGPLSTAQLSSVWKTTNTDTPNTNSNIDGPANTAAMIAAGATAHPCGQFCDNLTVGGFTDWYMPAKNELEVCYFNLKPSTTSNNTSSGINPNAVPARASNYTSGTPSRTSATAFRTGGAEVLASENLYWASNQVSATQGHNQYFLNGNQNYGFSKTSQAFVRAIRRIPF